mmetsp:Transcript_1978/g.4580  ORF Transcript_1978/g.4580 Transcript_1978/m.4580 type:complete len:643 (+) Transcript_1978:109-2037(+)|eukprot:CAMPEP_0178988758 /NCGR_PEP_ID=MMETSP0795-20121207/3980_1 /TAXON_ID=88552 /ORGANISM="Amoebophrya sp., Strain Ameob2" /LENGTH=642 /DNA_ID=CAMNT_0020680051 /DNA_START=32 /DNA_END=1960 /DNA_ORIENTATION=-
MQQLESVDFPPSTNGATVEPRTAGAPNSVCSKKLAQSGSTLFEKTKGQTYSQPHLNKRLVLNNKGFHEPPPELDRYVNVGHLDMSFNGMARLRNLTRLQELVSLHLQSNNLETITGLEYNTRLQTLNLGYNSIAKIQPGCLRHLKQLKQLNLSHNKLSCFPSEKMLNSEAIFRDNIPTTRWGGKGRQAGSAGGFGLGDGDEDEDNGASLLPDSALDAALAGTGLVVDPAEKLSAPEERSSKNDSCAVNTCLQLGSSSASSSSAAAAGRADNTSRAPPQEGTEGEFEADASTPNNSRAGNDDAASLSSVGTACRSEGSTHVPIQEDFESYEVARDFADELLALPSLHNLDLSWNEFKDFSVEDATAFFTRFEHVEVLYFHRNPGLRAIQNYRRRMVVALPNLRYLDEAPIFDRERAFARAFFEDGGLAGEKRAREKYKQSLREVKPTEDWDERKHWVTEQRRIALERIKKAEDLSKEKHSQYYEYLKQQEKREKDFMDNHQSKWGMFQPNFGGEEDVVFDDGSKPGSPRFGTMNSNEDPAEVDRRASYSCLDAPSLNSEARDGFEESVTKYLNAASGTGPATGSNPSSGSAGAVAGTRKLDEDVPGVYLGGPLTVRAVSGGSSSSADGTRSAVKHTNELEELD